MKKFYYLFFITLFLSSFVIPKLVAQDKIGKVTYYEGTVKIGEKSALVKVKLNLDVYDDSYIVTGKESMVEITWKSGKKSSLFQNKAIYAENLYENSEMDLKQKTSDVTTKFGSIFKTTVEKKKQQEGGIRRGEGDTVDTLQYALSFYESGEFSKAYQLFDQYISLYPNSPEGKEIYFAMAHCLIEVDDFDGAEILLKDFIEKYPEDLLSAYAEQILDEF